MANKLGDLIVKLRLDGKEYSNGLKKAEAKTKGFGGNIMKMAAKSKNVWMAVAAAAAAAVMGIIKSSNALGDAWTRNLTGMKASWKTFTSALASWDWKNLGKNMKDAFNAGKELADALDASFEGKNAVKLQSSANQKQLEEYRQELTDTNKSLDERIQAGERYLNFLERQSKKEIKIYKDIMNAQIKSWQATSGTNRTNAEVIDFFTNYTGKGSAAASKYADLAAAYENKNNDKTNGAVVDAIYEYNTAMSAWDSENRRVIHQVRELKGDLEKLLDPTETLNEIFEDACNMEIPEEIEEIKDEIVLTDDALDTSDLKAYFDAWDEQVKRFQEIASAFRDACIEGFGSGVQYITDSLFGLEEFNAGNLLKNLLEPLADLAIKQGEILIAEGIGVEACKAALESLNGAAAIAAGAALVAVGSAAKSGLQALANSGTGTSTTSGYTANSSDSRTSIESELTIYVKGTLKGSDIAISGQRTINNWSR